MANDGNSVQRVYPTPLPVTTDWHHKARHEKTLNDMVDEVLERLIKDPETGDKIRSYLEAVYDEQAIEGSLAADNLEIAHMIREDAKRAGPAKLAGQKKATIVKAMNVCFNRWEGLSRNERRNTVAGQLVAPTTPPAANTAQ